MTTLRSLALGLTLVALTACPGGSTSKKPLEPCKTFGQQCQLEPGKLGSCAYRANCTTSDCLYCQSQH